MTNQFTRQDLIQLAKLSDRAEKYNEMITYMLLASKFNQDFSDEERKLFTFAIKKSTQPRRTACTFISNIQDKKDKEDEQFQKCLQAFKQKIARELIQLCDDILEAVIHSLNNKILTVESKVYYLKIKGDCYRILAEQDFGNTHASDNAFETYSLGYDIAQQKLCPLNSIRLSLTNNFCVFYYEIMRDPTKACLTGQKLINLALDHAELNGCESCNNFTATKSALFPLVDNIKYWTFIQQENYFVEEL
ncbi:14-3-3 family protein 14-3-3 beta/zeta (macronuclear) [Tetrahymena thermophila SB210]|uniref:14-3-3 family protein 14-3-3 beta/zeta n=1 Tax=Tetrahymena thermophila (strain SB210) TaxID=312017 RepID=Q22WU6_TETTS|nr:14-3-3 family protein 14-3-3 beta/zeta [Tetrahymena thermophila SB210]EAR89746.2 14-3-3 family protein 14-3-3 beta/zeta [Tetrahymena thermophila SB210]|eukprot:XP_001009991.2 14-3-3 family protein 14-3-3 beta/zeta [Tetrahymena thermophila SB210]